MNASNDFDRAIVGEPVSEASRAAARPVTVSRLVGPLGGHGRHLIVTSDCRETEAHI